ncbi:MAG: glycine cleavage system protein GcvH [Alkalispirochaetaceae bacterium]
MKFDENCRYQKSHEYARQDGELYIVGISDYAQDELGDVVFVELPEIGASFEQGGGFGVVESVKAASDLYAPVSGEVVEVNERLKDEPELVNQDPFGEVWIIKLKGADASELENLMSAEEYKSFTEELD